jgi:hypothetical protein
MSLSARLFGFMLEGINVITAFAITLPLVGNAIVWFVNAVFKERTDRLSEWVVDKTIRKDDQ